MSLFAMRSLCLLSACGLLALSCGVTVPCPAAGAQRPNIVFFLADDLGHTDVSYHGGEIKTPNIDRLAAAGAKLEAFYVQPVCSPTRAALMTGRYPMRHGLQVGVVRPWASYGLPLDERTLAQALQQAGYVTAICGKWHLGHFTPEHLPTRRGFTHQYGHYNGALDYFDHTRDGGFDWHRDDRVSRDEGYSTVLLGNESVRLVAQHDISKPLFLYIPFNAPHTPLQALPEHLKLYAHIEKQQRRTYCAMVHAVDEQVGRVVAAIEQRGLTGKTLFIFSSDNGGPIGQGATNGRLRAGKGTLYEGGVRVSAFATWAGQIKAGLAIHEPLHMVDWFPTLLRLAGAATAQKHAPDGMDIWPVLTAGAKSPHDLILLNTTPNNGAVRMGDWKLVVGGNRADEGGESPTAKAKGKKGNQLSGESARVELFNLADDMSEQHNLAEKHPEKVKELRARHDAFAKQAVPPKSAPKAPDFKVPKIWGEPDAPVKP
ncbi:MAG: arylsulfatase [Verrucomicrobia bacterium]|nr:arylsulfatase [Verrucomicrobiota bacterium]